MHRPAPRRVSRAPLHGQQSQARPRGGARRPATRRPGIPEKTRQQLGGCPGPPLAACRPPSQSAESRAGAMLGARAWLGRGLPLPRAGPGLATSRRYGRVSRLLRQALRLKGPRTGCHCAGPQWPPGHPSCVLPTPICSRDLAQAVTPSFRCLPVPSCRRASFLGTLLTPLLGSLP